MEEFSEADSEENVEYKDIGSLQISKLIMLIDIQIIIKIVFISWIGKIALFSIAN